MKGKEGERETETGKQREEAPIMVISTSCFRRRLEHHSTIPTPWRIEPSESKSDSDLEGSVLSGVGMVSILFSLSLHALFEPCVYVCVRVLN